MQSGEDMPSLRKGTALLGQRMAKGAKPPFDITARAFEFALMVVEFAGRLPTGMAERYLAHQLIKSGTAIGTNVEEGDVPSLLGIALTSSALRKEAREPKYWYQVIGETGTGDSDATAYLADKALQLVRILSKMIEGVKQAQ